MGFRDSVLCFGFGENFELSKIHGYGALANPNWVERRGLAVQGAHLVECAMRVPICFTGITLVTLGAKLKGAAVGCCTVSTEFSKGKH